MFPARVVRAAAVTTLAAALTFGTAAVVAAAPAGPSGSAAAPAPQAPQHDPLTSSGDTKDDMGWQ
ncbi:hypothetical protein [Streptomyces alkaliterrae]|uniref:Uncharacterized protein n=1 Tax=Streptomyces alkaliterrae TaxID=2213162 RepID=A0A5P0YM05_9ACTN|nr:hypothetical protein [Streptomyces alkaliterrae]MBB1256058.1 hypothetical protein [Streptomyces alkaliterrae]MBB1257762.1 hypothetical protein [Streptomyces alkaliterrae]MQS01373.1 hypothetical protein [Streptomyces alkaliterrae]